MKQLHEMTESELLCEADKATREIPYNWEVVYATAQRLNAIVAVKTKYLREKSTPILPPNPPRAA